METTTDYAAAIEEEARNAGRHRGTAYALAFEIQQSTDAMHAAEQKGRMAEAGALDLVGRALETGEDDDAEEHFNDAFGYYPDREDLEEARKTYRDEPETEPDYRDVCADDYAIACLRAH